MLFYWWRNGGTEPNLATLDGYARLLGVRVALVDRDGNVVDVEGLYIPVEKEKPPLGG